MPRGSQFLGGLSTGLAKGAAALMGGDAAYQDAHDKRFALQSRIAQQLAAARASEANAEESAAKAAAERTKQGFLDRRPQLVEELVAGGSGADVPMVQAVRRFIQTGQRAQVPMGPETEEGQMGVGSQQFDPAVQSRIVQQLQRLAPALLGAGDIKVDDWAKANQTYRGMDLGDDVLAGRRTAGDVGSAQAAVEAKPLYNSDASGAVLDLFGGALDVNNPMAQGTISLKKDQAGAQRANAAQSYAAAENSRASAARTRAEMADGSNARGQKAPTGYRWSADGSLEPIPGGPADPATKGAKLAKPPTESQGKALAFASRMQVADEALNDLAEEGVDQPSRIKQLAESLPIIGTGAGMAANAVASGKQQQVEQAQRNFINAVLRRESGAVISPEEFRNAARQYFPQPNDDAETKRNKAINRRVATEAMKAEFGEQFLPDFDRIVGEARTARKKPAPANGGKPTAGAPQQRNVTVDF